MDSSNEVAELKSLTWLMENYHHIWFNKDLSVHARAGFLAACCDSRRCFLGTYSLKDRFDLIARQLPRFPIGRCPSCRSEKLDTTQCPDNWHY